jgi:hypothetical protein
MDEIGWLGDELGRTVVGFAWAVRQVPADRLELAPPAGLGEWSALRHLFHMVWHEREFALPTMRLWLGGTPFTDDGLDEEADWQAQRTGVELGALLHAFAEGRDEQRAFLARLDPTAWTEERLIGPSGKPRPAPLSWVVAKTYQHTAEHTNDVLRIALFWDRFAG